MSAIEHHFISGAPQGSPPLAVSTGGFVIARGILPIRYDNPRARIPEGIEQQTALVLTHVQQLLKQAGVEQSQIVTIEISLANLSRDFERMDRVYRTIFDARAGPARSCIGVSELPEGALIQINFLASSSISR